MALCVDSMVSPLAEAYHLISVERSISYLTLGVDFVKTASLAKGMIDQACK